jgi:adenylylsulfate kinase
VGRALEALRRKRAMKEQVASKRSRVLTKSGYTNGAVIWFTGLPSSGKSALGQALATRLRAAGLDVEWLDGDQVRAIFPSTGFSKAERSEHIRRMGFIAGLLEKHGIWVVATFVSPYAESRNFVRSLCTRFVEIHVATPVSVCGRRDAKGLYARARRGEIEQFTGISDPYEAPEKPDLVLDASVMTVEQGIEMILAHLATMGWLDPERAR